MIQIRKIIGRNKRRLVKNFILYFLTDSLMMTLISALSLYASYLAENPMASTSSIKVLMPIILGLY